jgi:hypothetical protein
MCYGLVTELMISQLVLRLRRSVELDHLARAVEVPAHTTLTNTDRVVVPLVLVGVRDSWKEPGGSAIGDGW